METALCRQQSKLFHWVVVAGEKTIFKESMFHFHYKDFCDIYPRLFAGIKLHRYNGDWSS